MIIWHNIVQYWMRLMLWCHNKMIMDQQISCYTRPAALKPFTTSDYCFLMRSYRLSIHLAPRGFIVDILRSIGEDFSPFSCFWTYHSWNRLRINSFALLLIVKSIGWSRSVQLAGIGTCYARQEEMKSPPSAELWIHQIEQEQLGLCLA